MSRTIVLGVALMFIAVLTFLTLFVLLWTGPDVLVVVSLVILGPVRIRRDRRARDAARRPLAPCTGAAG